MRITFHEVNSNLQYQIMKNYTKLADLQEKIATGRRLNRPSDDPVDVNNDLELREKLKAYGQYKRNVEDGLAWMGVTDSSLVSMNDIMQRIKELGIEASNDTYNSEQRSYVNRELNQLLRQLITLINTTYKGDYVFGGTNTKTAPYDLSSGTGVLTITAPGTAQSIIDTSVTPNITTVEDIIPGSVVVTDGAAITYRENVDYTIDYENATITPLAAGSMGAAGSSFTISFEWVKKADESNTDAIYREIEENVTPQINISADEVFIDPANNANLVDAIVSMGQALLQNNGANIRTSLTDINFIFQTILSSQATNGSRMNRFDLTQTRNEMQTVELTRLQSNIEDADLAEVISDFSVLQNVYTASLKAGAQIIQPSLSDFLQ